MKPLEAKKCSTKLDMMDFHQNIETLGNCWKKLFYGTEYCIILKISQSKVLKTSIFGLRTDDGNVTNVLTRVHSGCLTTELLNSSTLRVPSTLWGRTQRAITVRAERIWPAGFIDCFTAGPNDNDSRIYDGRPPGKNRAVTLWEDDSHFRQTLVMNEPREIFR